MNTSNHIVIVGPAGAGKTTLGRRLAKFLELDFLDVDEQIERCLGVSIDTIFAKEGEQGFRKRETKILKNILKSPTQHVVATGGGCVLSEKNRQMIRQQRLVIYLDVEIHTQFKRVANDRRRPLFQCDDLRKRLESQRKIRTPLYEQVSDMTFVSNKLSFRKIAGTVAEALK